MNELIKSLIDEGFVISLWRQESSGRLYEVEISMPQWGGSECECGKTLKSALEKAAKRARKYKKESA